jgi:acyl-CoA synthetase (AMP-forming)/AMP-acid ligase II
MVRAASASWADRPSITYPDFTWTFRELAAETGVTARGLIALGVRPGDHVAVLVPNGADFMRAFFGASRAGAVAVTLSTRYRKADLEYVLAHCDATTLIMSRQLQGYFDFEALVREIFDERPELRPKHVVVLGCEDAGEFVSGTQLGTLAADVAEDADVAASAARDPDDVAAMLYTSGTTAFPKGCLLSHRALTGSTAAWGIGSIELGPGKSIWIPNPLFHIGALTSLLASVGAGSLFLSQPYFEPNAAVQMLIDNAVTAFFPVFDAVALPILEHPRAKEVRFDKVEYAFVTGNPNNVQLVKNAIPHARHLNTYGMTEACGWCCLNFDDTEPLGPLPGGMPLPGVDVRVVDIVTEAQTPTGEVGRIQLKSYCTFSGYYKDEAATRRALLTDGWFDTGDLGVRKSDGSLRFQGRDGDMIKVGGENVSPLEIETFLAKHAAVRQVAVVGIDDSRLGQVPAAFVETYPGEPCTEDELLEMCSGSLARFKVPRHVRFLTVDQWPMSATKIRKSDLRNALNNELGGSGSR